MKILVTGATGFVGKALVDRLLESGHSVAVVTRQKHKAVENLPSQCQIIQRDLVSEDLLPEDLKGIEGVVHLMGENLSAKRWSQKQKEKIWQSRINSTENLVKGIKVSEVKVFICTSAIGIYPKNLTKILDERSSVVSDQDCEKDFLAHVCKEWERKGTAAESLIRTLILRFGVVLDKEGGVLKKLLPIFKSGLAGPIASGKQGMSWIHRQDLVSIIVKGLEDHNYSGVINAVSPLPVSNLEFTKTFGEIIHRPTFFPVPAFALKMLYGEMSTLMLDGQWIVSQKLKERDFTFKYPKIAQALEDILTS